MKTSGCFLETNGLCVLTEALAEGYWLLDYPLVTALSVNFDTKQVGHRPEFLHVLWVK